MTWAGDDEPPVWSSTTRSKAYHCAAGAGIAHWSRVERGVRGLAEPVAVPVVERVVPVDDQRFSAEPLERGPDRPGVLAISQEHLRLAVLQDVGDRARVEACVDRVEHRAAHRDAEV